MSGVKLSFSEALQAVKSGEKIAREGWNGAGQYVSIANPARSATPGGVMVELSVAYESAISDPFLVLKNSQDRLVSWVPSQGDLFAEDWIVL